MANIVVLKCPKCGSDNLIKHGLQWQMEKSSSTGKPERVQRYRCNSCGRFTIRPEKKGE